MLINKTELSGPGGKPVEIDHSINHAARIRSRLDAIAARLPAPTEQPIIDVTPRVGASPSAVLVGRIKDVGQRE
jgi:hypothetical protein